MYYYQDALVRTLPSQVELPTSDPRGFGPIVWKALHTLAVNYPIKASKDKQKQCCRFLYSLSHLLPCESCGKEFRKFLKKNDYQHCVQGRMQLTILLMNAHNNIKKHTRPYAKPWTLQDIIRKYKTVLVRRPLSRLWSSNPESHDQKDCSCSSSVS